MSHRHVVVLFAKIFSHTAEQQITARRQIQWSVQRIRALLIVGRRQQSNRPFLKRLAVGKLQAVCVVHVFRCSILAPFPAAIIEWHQAKMDLIQILVRHLKFGFGQVPDLLSDNTQ